MRLLRTFAFGTAGFAFAVIVIGFIVRITGSGMGCGPDWPLCNGQVIPEFTSAEVAIEWLHRIAVVGLTLLTVATVGLAVAQRGAPGGAGPGGTLRPAALALGLLVVQSLLGRRAVKLELDPATVVLHLGLALALLAVLLVLGLRAGGTGRPAAAGGRPPWGVVGALGVSLAVILLGGLTANLGAGWACVGFPLCSGTLWPDASAGELARLHWVHRLLAYGLFALLLGLAIVLQRTGAPRRIALTAWTAFGLGATQVVVGAVMVLTTLPPVWRGLHAVIGTALWVILVYLTWVAAGNLGRPMAAHGPP